MIFASNIFGKPSLDMFEILNREYDNEIIASLPTAFLDSFWQIYFPYVAYNACVYIFFAICT